MIELEVLHIPTGERLFCWGYSEINALERAGYTGDDYKVLFSEFID